MGSSRSGSSSRSRLAKRPSRWRWVARLFALAVVTTLIGAIGVVGLIAYYSRDLPDVRTLRDVEEPQTTRVVDRDDEVLGEIFTERRTVVPIERIPRVLVLSVLAAEDADFYQHEGFDYAGLFRAVVRGILSGGRFRGTSTITQQLVKNMLLTNERSLARKIRELILAYRLEQEFTKEEILELYLNHINFGHGRYGVQEAARFYFGKDVSELTLAEAAMLAGIPQSPTHLSPRAHPEAARRRQEFVLAQLEDKREERWPDLSLEEIQRARETPIELAPLPESRQSAPEIVEMARRALHELVGEEAARRGGYTVHVTIDADLQRATRQALQEGLRSYDDRHDLEAPLRRQRLRRGERPRTLDRVPELRVGGTYDAMITERDDRLGTIGLDIGGHAGVASIDDVARWNEDELPPSRFAEEGARVRVSVLALAEDDDPNDGIAARATARLELGPQGAVILLDPRSREVLALVGGYDAEPGFNRAVQAQRQPGSTFKPIVYALGIQSRRFTAASIVLDAPGVYGNWQPRNFEGEEYRGEIRLREALAISSNAVAARLMDDLGSPAVVAFARQLGFTSDLEAPASATAGAPAGAPPEDMNMALALGAREVRPIELANAYATFASGGRWAPWQILSRIEGPGGAEVPLPPREEPRDVLSPEESFVVTSLLTSVVAQGGTGARARDLGRPVAAKTGTSNEARDVWFAGYTPELVGVVWVGYDDQRSLGARETGGRTALPIWVSAMRTAVGDRPRTEFPQPAGVVTVTIDRRTGLLPYAGQTEDTIDEVFLDGTAPTTQAPEPGTLDAASFLMQDEPQGLGDTTPDDPPGPLGGEPEHAEP
ncbi:MAG: PBP1A family penicillin-binding protein [Sandaracinaceae bacterium]|nr:PBP1A family penicillin-binding protein [Sandaracinaceae bacterium]